MLWKMIRIEQRRLVRKRKLWLLGIVMLMALLGGIINYLGYDTPQRTSFEAFSFATSMMLPLLLPLLAGFSTGDVLLEDRQAGLLALVLSRGVSPWQYVISKVVVSAVGQACFVGGALVMHLIILLPFFPAGPILTYASRYSLAFATSQPAAYCLITGIIFTVAALAFNGIALLLSVWVKNAFIVMAAPTMLYIAVLYGIGVDTPLRMALNPYVNLALQEFSVPLSLTRMAFYWFMITLFTHALAIVAFSLRRDYA